MYKQMRLLVMAMFMAATLALAGCGSGDNMMEKMKDLEFTVLSEDDFPEELKTMIDEKKVQPFKMTYQDNGFMYICIGYGQQETGGYSICVNDLYETDNAIYADTTLLGPEPGTIDLTKKNSPSYPTIVLKTEYLEKSVVFN